MAYGPLFVPRPSKIIVRRLFESRSLRKLLPQRSKLLSTFHPGSKRYMFAIHGAINASLRQTNALKKRLSNGVFLGFRSLDPSLLNAPKAPQFLTSLVKTIKRIGVIEKVVVILTFAGHNVQALSQLLGSMRAIFLQITIVTGRLEKMIETRIKFFVTIITKIGILLTSAPSLKS